MQRGKAITPKVRDELEEALRVGRPHHEIANQFGLTTLTVKKISHLLNRLEKSK